MAKFTAALVGHFVFLSPTDAVYPHFPNPRRNRKLQIEWLRLTSASFPFHQQLEKRKHLPPLLSDLPTDGAVSELPGRDLSGH